MEETDQIFAFVARQQLGSEPIIVCLYTGVDIPSSCAPMLRSPAPPIDQMLSSDLAFHIADARRMNEAVHDGAVMIGRKRVSDHYQIKGWSYRLFPPSTLRQTHPNRGSAFNSCLEMSTVPYVDRLYLIARRKVSVFENGCVRELCA